MPITGTSEMPRVPAGKGENWRMILDLCCGLGRFDTENEDVISIDIQRKVKPTIIADVHFLPLRPKLKPRLCHASPPCKYFSWARMIRQGYDEKGIAQSLRLVAACFDAFDYLEPQMWTLENPKGLLRRILPKTFETAYHVAGYPHKKTDFWTNEKGLKRAMIPQDVRQKILLVAQDDRTNERTNEL